MGLCSNESKIPRYYFVWYYFVTGCPSELHSAAKEKLYFVSWAYDAKRRVFSFEKCKFVYWAVVYLNKQGIYVLGIKLG